MDIDELNTIKFDFKTIEVNPKNKIHDYFQKVREEIEDHYDHYMFSGDINGNIKMQKLDSTDRIEISYKKDRMLELLELNENQCLANRSDKQFARISNQLKDLQEKLSKVSNEFFFDDYKTPTDKKGEKFLLNNNKNRNKCIEIEDRLKREIFETDRQLFMNRSIFFVRNTKNDQQVPKQIFGYMVNLDYFLKEDELQTLKKNLEDSRNINYHTKVQHFQFNQRNNLKYVEQFGEDLKINILNHSVLTLIKIFGYLLERMKDHYEDFINITEKFLRKNILITEDMYLQYDRNELDYIEPCTFQTFRRLICLDLFMNHLKLIEVETFKGLSNLECLILNENQISYIQPESFKDMSNLTELFLDSNNINKLDKGVFDGLKSLQKLSLANNCIDKLDMFGKYGNSGLESLNYLNINNNKISTIESNTFKNLVNLNSLYLIGNRITCIKKYAFLGLTKLNKLSLSNNQLREIEHCAFDGMPNLDFLNLKQNKLEMLREFCFQKLPSLRNLDMSFNQIEASGNFSFLGITKGVLLNISNNKFDSNPEQIELFERQAQFYNIFLIF